MLMLRKSWVSCGIKGLKELDVQKLAGQMKMWKLVHSDSTSVVKYWQGFMRLFVGEGIA